MKGLLVGFGSIGRRHMTNLHALGVTDWTIVHSGRGTLPLEPPCPARAYSDLDEALRAERPDFAVIANPTTLHVTTASKCVDAGCHLLIEKPVSDSLEGIEALRDDVAAHGLQALVGFQFRFHPALRRIQQLLSDGLIGAPLHVRAVWGEYLPSWHPWEDWRAGYAARADLGGGVHHTICHPIDYLRMLFGDPKDVTASLTVNGLLGLSVAEAADVILGFDGPMTAQLHLDYWTRPPVHRVEIVCATGSIRWDYLAGEFAVWDAQTEEWQVDTVPGVEERNEMFMSEARHFVDVMSGVVEPICTLDDGLAVAQVCDRIERAASRDSCTSSEVDPAAEGLQHWP